MMSLLYFQLTAALHFFANGSYQKAVGKDYQCGLSQPSVSRSLKEIVNILNEHFSHLIKFPNNLMEITSIKTT